MKYLQPLILRQAYFQPIEQIIKQEFNQALYYKIFDIIGQKEYLNSISTLIQAIKNGRIWYENEHFKGTFSARTSIDLKAIGAQYREKTKSFFLPRGNVPPDILIAQADADRKIDKMKHQIFHELSLIDPESFDFTGDIESSYDHSLSIMETDFRQAAYKALAINPEINKAMREKLAEDYTNNLNLYIKGWISENIPKLRDEVEQHIMTGGRAEGLHKAIEQNYQVSVNKARFLARQETSLLMSKYREQRYGDIGINEYRWSGANDERERPDHKHLNGKVFRFDNPPVTCLKTGARNNPGEDYGCRCVAVGIVH